MKNFLGDSEQRTRSIIDNVVDGIIIIDERGTIQAINPAGERIFGYRSAELIGQNVSMLMPHTHRLIHDECITSYLRTGEAKIIGVGREVTGLRHDGSDFPMDLSIGEFRDGDHRFFTGIVRDITKRRQTEESLRRYASRLEKLREIDLAILASQSTREIAAAALEHLERLVPCWTGVAMIYDLDGGEAEVIGSVGVSRQWHPPGTRVPHGLGGKDEQDAIRRRPATVVVDDTAGEVLESPMMESLRAGGMRSSVLMQLSDRTELIGSLLLGSDCLRAYSSDSVDAVREVAGQLGVAIRQALLLEDVRWAKARSSACRGSSSGRRKTNNGESLASCMTRSGRLSLHRRLFSTAWSAITADRTSRAGSRTHLLWSPGLSSKCATCLYSCDHRCWMTWG